MGKPREWWIAFHANGDDFKECYKRYVVGPKGFNNLMPHEVGIHVIEYSAFEAMTKERDEYRAAHTHLSNIDKRSIGSIILERDALAAQLAEEKDSLAHYKNELSLSLIASDRYKAQLAEAKRREQLAADVDSDNQDVITKLQMQLSDMKREAMKLRGALVAEINVVKYAGYNPHISEAILTAFDDFMAHQEGAE